MANQTVVFENGNSHRSADHGDTDELDIFPLSCYYFGSREAVSLRNETVAERVLRMKANYDAYGMRKCVSAVLVVELFKHPHLLLLQVQNSTFKLPGGRLRAGESDIDGLKRKLSNNLSVGEDGRGPEWEELDHDQDTKFSPINTSAWDQIFFTPKALNFRAKITLKSAQNRAKSARDNSARIFQGLPELPGVLISPARSCDQLAQQVYYVPAP